MGFLNYLIRRDAVDRPSFEELLGRPEWMRWGSCRDQPQRRFFPRRGHDTRLAKLICEGCAVQFECLAFAMVDDTLEGIWGGTSGWQRRQRRTEALRIVSSAAV